MEASTLANRDPFLILYGSETGNAEEVAFKLHQQFSSHGHRFLIKSIDEYDVSLLPSEKLIVWIVATAGEGEVPLSMKKFWKFLLRKSLSTASLQGVSSAVFGLGDSSYEKFNSAARCLIRKWHDHVLMAITLNIRSFYKLTLNFHETGDYQNGCSNLGRKT